MLCIDDVYGGTNRQFRKIVAPTSGIHIDFHDLLDLENHALHEQTKLVWLETPTNPTMKITDISALSKRLHQDIGDDNNVKNDRIILAVDNTFCSPHFQNPLNLGADLVVHSVTKYIGGHSDVVMGVVCTNDKDLYTRLRFVQNGIGAVPSPFDCFLAHRGLKTLHIRMEASARYGEFDGYLIVVVLAAAVFMHTFMKQPHRISSYCFLISIPSCTGQERICHRLVSRKPPGKFIGGVLVRLFADPEDNS